MKRPFVSTKRGGARQRAAREDASASAGVSASPSSVATHLLELWAWGHISPSMIQAIMSRMREDLESASRGVLDMSEIDALAGLGSSGRHVCNLNRDLNDKLGDPPLHAAISRYEIPLKTPHHGFASVPRLQEFLLPHEMFAHLHDNHPSAFESKMTGSPGKLE